MQLRWLLIFIFANALIGIPAANAQSNVVGYPWMAPANPTLLNWLALQKQANEGETEFGENGLTVNFYLGPASYELGIIYCDIEYLPSTSAKIVQIVEDGSRRRFESPKPIYPWLRVEIKKKVAR